MPIQQGDFSDRLNFGWFLNSRELIGNAAEVGTHRGGFAERLMFTWMGKKLYCIDPYLPGYDDDPAALGDRGDDFRRAQEVLDPFKNRVVFDRTPSPDAAGRFRNDFFSFVYIDGCHRTAAVLSDMEAWWPKVYPGGILAGHDFLERGGPWGAEVQPAVLGFASRHGLTCYLVTEPSGAPWSWYFIKPENK